MKDLKTDYLSIFEHICTIPHGSGNIKKIAEFCRDFAVFHGCKAEVDVVGNVIIKCPASKGYENKETIILQGHTDMVCDKSPESNHNFETDPLKLIYENGFLRADGTTLGGDDGIAVAFALSIIANKDLKHPPLEILLTADEETGLYGAIGLDGSLLKCRKMINIDSEEEGTLLAGCAGGITANFKKEYKTEEYCGNVISLYLKGLAGGHSGAEIHKKRLNAVKVLASVSKKLLNENCRLVEFSGGNKMNAIPFDATSMLAVNNKEEAENIAKEIALNIERLAISPDDKPILYYSIVDEKVNALSYEDSENLLDFIDNLPDGIISYTDDSKSLVQTSLNLGVADYSNGVFSGTSLIRSSVNSDLDLIAQQVKSIANEQCITVSFTDRYSAWEFKQNSFLRDKMCQIYEKMFGKELKVNVIHAGLECGILSDKMPGLDCVSIGPDIHDIHTYREKLDLASAERTYNFILKVLEEI